MTARRPGATIGARSFTAWLLVAFSPAASPLTTASVAGVMQDADSDGDTMPDAWETFFDLDPDDPADAGQDPDGDGLTNAQEFAAGRHPRSFFARYFAEGATGYFDTTLAIVNISATDEARVSVALLTEAGSVLAHRVALAPRQRTTIPINPLVSAPAAVSLIVESDQPVAAERSMRWGTGNTGNTVDSGSSAPSTTWYFAEGATGPFYLYYLLENPGDAAGSATVRYLREIGSPIVRTHNLPAHSRTTIFVNGQDPALASATFGAAVDASVPILAERAMYLDVDNTFGGGAASSGSPELADTWRFAEGAAGPFFDAFLSLVNPGASAVTAAVTYHLADGTEVPRSYEVPAGSRRTIYVNATATTDPALAGLNAGPFWISLAATGPIVAERAMWWSGWPWYEGHAALGHRETGPSWVIAEGSHGSETNDQTYVLVANSSNRTGQVRVTLVPDAGAASTRDLPIAPFERLTVNVGSLFQLAASRFSVLVTSLDDPPLPLVADYARYFSAAGVPFSAGGAATAMLEPPPHQPDARPEVTGTTPVSGATGVAASATITVSFSESVTVGAEAFTIACPTGTPPTGAPQPFTLSASPATAFTLTPVAPLAEGVVCTVTVHAAEVHDVDRFDPPEGLAADYIFTFSLPPRAVDDTRSVLGNVAIDTTISGFSVLANDLGAGLTVSSADTVSERGGAVSVAANGMFTYSPPVGYDGPDSFTYRMTGAMGVDFGTVRLTVASTVWFIDNQAPACTSIVAGCGRLATPLSTLPAFLAANGGALMNGTDIISPEAGDRVFIYTGSGAYVGPLNLETGQRVVGQGAMLPFRQAMEFFPPPDVVPLPPTNGAPPMITSTANGVNLAANNGVQGLFLTTAGIAINGTANVGALSMRDLTIDNTTGPGIVVTGGGTVGIGGNANTITTTTAIPIQITNTTISNQGVIFRRISTNGAPNGIMLTNTGTTGGGFWVTGNGLPRSGGTIRNITNRGASFINTGDIELVDMLFADAAMTNGADPADAASGCGDLNVGGNLACNAALHFVNISSHVASPAVRLINVEIDDSAQVGINLNNVAGMTLTNTTVTDIGNEVREFGIKGRNVRGLVTISGLTVDDSYGENVRLENNSGSIGINISGSTFTNAFQGGGFFLVGQGHAVATLNVTTSTFSNNFTTGLLAGVSDPAATGTFTVNVDGGTFTNNNAGIQVIGAGGADVRFDLTNVDTITGNPASGIALDLSDTSTAAGSLIGSITGNTITMPTFGSGNGIGLSARGAGTTTLRVSGNTVVNRSQYGIFLHRKEGPGPGVMNATVTGNQVTTEDVAADLQFPIDGIRVEAGAASLDSGAVCAFIDGNTATGANANPDAPGADIRLRQRFATTFALPALVGTTAASAIALLNTQNPAAALIDATTTSAFTGGGSCPLPP